MGPRSTGSPLFWADLSVQTDERDLTSIGSRALRYCSVRRWSPLRGGKQKRDTRPSIRDYAACYRGSAILWGPSVSA
jgi:hypothetical protein